MKTILILAAFAAFSTLAATGNAAAAIYSLSADETEICRTLELAHESSCAEYTVKLIGQHAAADALGAEEATGSIAAPAASYIPYVNGAGDPDGLTRSNRQVSAR